MIETIRTHKKTLKTNNSIKCNKPHKVQQKQLKQYKKKMMKHPQEHKWK